MKKIVLMILCLALLSGCSRASAPETSDTAPSSAVPTTQTPTTQATKPQPETLPEVAYEGQLVAFHAEVLQREFVVGTDAVLKYTYQQPEFLLSDPQVAESLALAFWNLVDYEGASVTRVFRDASNAPGAAPWDLQVLYSPERMDDKVISLLGAQSLTEGDGRHTRVNQAVSFDLITGKTLQLKDILREDYSVEVLSGKIVAALEPMAKQNQLYSDYAYVISQMFATNTQVKNWYFSSLGLCFFFEPYEIAPHSAGTVTAEIAYEDLAGLLRADYFPQQRPILAGTPVLEALDLEDLNRFTRFCEVTLEPQGEERVLHIRGAISNPRLAAGRWEDIMFLSAGTLFAAAFLSEDDAIVIRATEEQLKNTVLLYESGDAVISVPLWDLIP